MRKILLLKIRESFTSVFPVAAIVLLLNLTPLVNFTWAEMGVFAVSAFFLILGIGLFNMGADMAMTPMGEHMGSGLTKTGKLGLLLSVCFAMGLFITIAEPDLTVLAEQVQGVIPEKMVLIITVGVGVGLFLLLSVIKMVTHKSLPTLLMFFYMIMFMVTALVIVNGNEGFLALSYDSGGVTTGPITVPFIMALGVGIASTLGGKNVSENSFGLVAMCSVGPILAVLLLGMTNSGEITYTVPGDYTQSVNWNLLLTTVLHTMKEVAIAVGLIVAFFIILQITCLKLPKKRLVQISVGILYTFVGLVVFLTAVKVGFVPTGYRLGRELAGNNKILVVIFGFVLGLVTVLAEPAVHVLNKQVEDVTDGTVSKRSMMIALCIGVGASIALSMIRIIFDFSILYYLIPGYLISLGLSFFVPGLYTAIAFDSGGVASGPLTSSFVLPLAVGVCCVIQGESHVMSDAFGLVAMVAMAPLITIQLLGFRAVVAKKVQDRIAMRRILAADDEQIIDFN
ncbi:MAG: DUF1538 domain-containing protein [Ruminococcaceae bacterium]|nr:DUF1538 domain-containing protein [Oscillospiraceae bacterium]